MPAFLPSIGCGPCAFLFSCCEFFGCVGLDQRGVGLSHQGDSVFLGVRLSGWFRGGKSRSARPARAQVLGPMAATWGASNWLARPGGQKKCVAQGLEPGHQSVVLVVRTGPTAQENLLPDKSRLLHGTKEGAKTLPVRARKPVRTAPFIRRKAKKGL